jgi:hypothetical protein
LHGYAWTPEAAEELAKSIPTKTYISDVHLIEINGQWHRVNVLPATNIFGDLDKAQPSRIETEDIPKRMIPAMFIQRGNDAPKRLSLNLDKALETIAGLGSNREGSMFKLFTYRTGGALPEAFLMRDLFNDTKVQERVYRWLESEINARTK